MHLLVPFAAPPAATGGPAVALPRLPQLQALLANAEQVDRFDGDVWSWSPPHERALAEALGWPLADGCMPWAARAALADGLPAQQGAWALATPAHWQVGSDGVSMSDPAALALDDAGSRAFVAALAGHLADIGWTLHCGAAQRWYLVHPDLAALRTASLDRVIGRSVDAWLGDDASMRPVRRLQSEVQMLLHDHPLNAAREAAGLLPVNSFWLSGCGSARPDAGPAPVLHGALRGPALSGDIVAWREAWQALDATVMAAAVQAAAAGEPVRLTLCGERSSVALASRPQTAWSRMRSALRPPPAVAVLLQSL